ncbi:hypothetical protein IFR05_014334 [Cadophora sp. M221]|nr:hypothetical protein IFR05_014334 [Cadophora sp. M221]
MNYLILLLLATTATCHDPSPPINIGILLFPGFQPLDVIGPLDVFNSLGIQREIHTSFITSNSTLTPISFSISTLPWFTLANPVGSDTNGAFVPTYTFATSPPLDVLLIPGGIGTRAPAPLLDSTVQYVRDVYPSLQYLVTVCTGSGIAARAGVLDGKKATTNKLAWAQTIALGSKVKWVAEARWVRDGNISGIDVAVAFVAEVYSEAAAVKVTNMLEYERHTNATDDPFARLSQHLLEMSNIAVTPAFPQFALLPTEIRLRIWRAALDANLDGRGRIVKVLFRRRLGYLPAYTMRERGNDLRSGITELPRIESPAEFGFAFDLFPLIKATESTQLQIPWVNKEVYHEYFPDVLRLRRANGRQAGLAVRFNARFDTIWIDLESLRALYDYIRPSRRTPGQVSEGGYGPSIIERKRNLTGFDRIQRLMTPLPATPTVDGIEYLRLRLFTGLTEPIQRDDSPTTVGAMAAAFAATRVQLPTESPAQVRRVAQCQVSHRRISQAARDFMAAQTTLNLLPEWVGPTGIYNVMIAELYNRVMRDSLNFFAVSTSIRNR